MSVIERERQATEVEGPITEREHRARTLEAAALEIEVRGWTQGLGMSCDGKVCLLGAVAIATGLPADHWSDAEIHSTFGDSVFPEDWNDAPERTDEEVTFLLRWRAEEIRDGR